MVKKIDFNVDFEAWPPHRAATQWLRANFDNVVVYDPAEGSSGYLLRRVPAKLSYGLVVDTQQQVTAAMSPDGGVCESWGVQG